MILITSFIENPDEISEFLDNWINHLQHPFFMMVFGILFWFTLEWSIDMKKRAREKITFWQDQKDEITLTFLGGLMFLVWDDEIIAGYDMLFVSGKLESHELQPFMYLMVGPAVERIVWAYKKLKGGSKNGGQG